MNLWATSEFGANPNNGPDFGSVFIGSSGPSGPGTGSAGEDMDAEAVDTGQPDSPRSETRNPLGPITPQIVATMIDASVTVADEETLVLETMAGITGSLDVYGRADIYGRVLGRVTVHPSGWLNLYGYVVNDIAIEPGGTAQIGGFVKGSIVGRGRHGCVVTSQAIVLGRRIRTSR